MNEFLRHQTTFEKTDHHGANSMVSQHPELLDPGTVEFWNWKATLLNNFWPSKKAKLFHFYSSAMKNSVIMTSIHEINKYHFGCIVTKQPSLNPPHNILGIWCFHIWFLGNISMIAVCLLYWREKLARYAEAIIDYNYAWK